MLVWVDSVVCILIRWGMIGFVYLISLIILLMEIVGNIYMIFEEEFSDRFSCVTHMPISVVVVYEPFGLSSIACPCILFGVEDTTESLVIK